MFAVLFHLHFRCQIPILCFRFPSIAKTFSTSFAFYWILSSHKSTFIFPCRWILKMPDFDNVFSNCFSPFFFFLFIFFEIIWLVQKLCTASKQKELGSNEIIRAGHIIVFSLTSLNLGSKMNFGLDLHKAPARIAQWVTVWFHPGTWPHSFVGHSLKTQSNCE